MLAAGYVLVTIGSFVGAVGDVRALLRNYEGGARYAFVPAVLLLWLLLANVRRDRRVQSLVCTMLLAVGLSTSASTWREGVRWRESWPVWAAEVDAWRRDPRTPLRIWPKGWTCGSPAAASGGVVAAAGAGVEPMAVPRTRDDALASTAASSADRPGAGRSSRTRSARRRA